MIENQHSLSDGSIGTSRTVHSFHYGVPGGRKVYVQAGLHASELPGMLVCHYLRQMLEAEEAHGAMLGEVVIVPVANPIGLDQTVLSYQMGRFDLASGENFNRRFPDLALTIAKELEGQFVGDVDADVALVRATLQRHLNSMKPIRQADSLRAKLLAMACDADIVLDLHCDCESVLHLYAHPQSLDEVMPLAALMGAHATLYAAEQGNTPFDEVCSSFWVKLQEQIPHARLPLPTVSICIELRGQLEVSHSQAQEDAARIVDYMKLQGVIAGQSSVHIPELIQEATPLAGTEVLYAEAAGVIVYLVECGQLLHPGDPVVDVVDPVTGVTQRFHAGVKGVLFARQNRRYAMPGMDLAYISGSELSRQGHLLSA
ncbi:succinylglutamate desuccinylase/aspartoacylase family protein [Pseudomonas sp. NPDC089422]|uniref:succinylglutamate desuccinylase/aspartoacylase family protein n=1 Tax=Pseudomonas sp. NPDC089422 TaxID=3364466 RepID=UPI00381B6290